MEDSRVPLFRNPLMKGLAGNPVTNYTTATETVPTTSINASESDTFGMHSGGHRIFRRYTNGMLDFGYAVGKIVIALEKAKTRVAPLMEVEEIVLGAFFPEFFSQYADGLGSHYRRVSLRISDQEYVELVLRVGEYLQAQRDYAVTASSSNS